MSDALEVLATGKKRTKVVATINNGDALLSKQEIEVIEKELKALMIVKEKRVNADLLYYSKNLDDYNGNIVVDNRMLTKEEFDLLNEVLNNGL